MTLQRGFRPAALMAALLLLSLPPCAQASGISYAATKAAGIPVKVITIYLSEPNIKVAAQMAQHGPGSSEAFKSMIRRSHPNVAITGTFFSLGSLRPTGDIVIDGRLAYFGGYGTALCIAGDNSISFVRPEPKEHFDWGDYDFVMRSGPRLLLGGKVPPDLMHEEFCSPYLLAPHPRLAIGATRDGNLLIVATRASVHFSRLARAMKSLGAVDAINLDGGSSIGLYYNGRTIIGPGRHLTNLILVYDDPWRYDKFKNQLFPAYLRSTRR